MRVLVLGGTGFIGAVVVRKLLEREHVVSTFHRGEPSGGVGSIRGDRRDLPAYRDAFRRLAPEVVLDTIAYTEGDGQMLVDTFRGLATRLVVLSSQDVYAAYGRLLRLESGPPDPRPLGEDAPLRTARHPYRAMARPGEMAYDYDKILVESAVTSGASLPVTILRLPCVYGPGDHQHRLGGYLARMVDPRSVVLLDAAKASWRWTRGYVENVADAIAEATTDPRTAGRTYNAGEERTLTEIEWVREIGAAAGWEGEVRAVPREELPAELLEPYDFAHDLVADTGRIRSELLVGERIDREEALRRTVEGERESPGAGA